MGGALLRRGPCVGAPAAGPGRAAARLAALWGLSKGGSLVGVPGVAGPPSCVAVGSPRVFPVARLSVSSAPLPAVEHSSPAPARRARARLPRAPRLACRPVPTALAAEPPAPPLPSSRPPGRRRGRIPPCAGLVSSPFPPRGGPGVAAPPRGWGGLVGPSPGLVARWRGSASCGERLGAAARGRAGGPCGGRVGGGPEPVTATGGVGWGRGDKGRLASRAAAGPPTCPERGPRR